MTPPSIQHARRRLLWGGLAAALPLLAAPAWAQPPPPRSVQALVGVAAPEVRARRVADAAPVGLEDHGGRPVLLVFFATWCGACRQLEPALEALHRDLGPRGLAVVALSHEPRADLLAGLARRPVAYTVAQCTGRTAVRYAATAVPTVVLVDGTGVVRGAWQGPGPGEMARVRAAAEALLRRSAGAPAP